MRARLEDKAFDKSSMDLWLKSQRRAFAIEAGQIEGLYLLKRGITETLIAEGFEGVRGAHAVIDVSDQTLKGLLEDQASVTGITPFGKRIETPLRKGQYKIRPNNPRRADGFVHEYCPPEQVEQEMEKFLAFHNGHRKLGLAPEVEAAWLHHEFVRIHPFQDGNGRISRMLMAYAYASAGEFPPIIPAQNKLDYIEALEAADGGNFPAFVNYLGDLAAPRSNAAALRAEAILANRTHFRHGNGGITHNGVYHPPKELLPEVEEEPEPESSPPSPGM